MTIHGFRRSDAAGAIAGFHEGRDVQQRRGLPETRVLKGGCLLILDVLLPGKSGIELHSIFAVPVYPHQSSSSRHRSTNLKAHEFSARKHWRIC